jgi:hypothetical protein
VYKTLGFKWLFERSAPHQVPCNLTGKSPAIPNVSYTQPLWATAKNKSKTIMDFFDLAEKKEQSKRHLNFVYSICTTTFNRDESLLSKLRFAIENKTTEGVFDIVFNNNDYLNLAQRDFLLYLKSKYEISDETFTDIIGFHEFGPEMRSPQKYSKKNNLLLTIHLIAISLHSGFTIEQQSIIQIISKLILTPVQVQYLVDITYNELNVLNSFNNFHIIENRLINKIEEKFNLSF